MNSANLSFRILASEDVDAYKELRLKALKESPASFSESYEDESVLPSHHFLQLMGLENEHFTIGCFQDDRKLIGISSFRRDKRSKAIHKAYVYTMYVAPEARGKKVAQTLLSKTVDIAKTFAGLEQIHLWVLNPHTSAARSLYIKAGWIPQGVVVKDDLKIDGKYVDAEYMTLRL